MEDCIPSLPEKTSKMKKQSKKNPKNIDKKGTFFILPPRVCLKKHRK